MTDLPKLCHEIIAAGELATPVSNKRKTIHVGDQKWRPVAPRGFGGGDGSHWEKATEEKANYVTLAANNAVTLARELLRLSEENRVLEKEVEWRRKEMHAYKTLKAICEHAAVISETDEAKLKEYELALGWIGQRHSLECPYFEGKTGINGCTCTESIRARAALAKLDAPEGKGVGE